MCNKDRNPPILYIRKPLSIGLVLRELLRIPVPRTWVNKGREKKGQGRQNAATPPYSHDYLEGEVSEVYPYEIPGKHEGGALKPYPHVCISRRSWWGVQPQYTLNSLVVVVLFLVIVVILA